MSEAFGELPASWAKRLGDETDKPYFDKLRSFVAAERAEHDVFPPAAEVFAAFEHTPYDAVRVLLVGQDPYHDDDQAHGLCFSVRRGIKLPPSLRSVADGCGWVSSSSFDTGLTQLGKANGSARSGAERPDHL